MHDQPLILWVLVIYKRLTLPACTASERNMNRRIMNVRVHSQLTFSGLNDYYEDSFRSSSHIIFVKPKSLFSLSCLFYFVSYYKSEFS